LPLQEQAELAILFVALGAAPIQECCERPDTREGQAPSVTARFERATVTYPLILDRRLLREDQYDLRK
jgi:hypothetical protein